jgi:hypothetical protein
MRVERLTASVEWCEVSVVPLGALHGRRHWLDAGGGEQTRRLSHAAHDGTSRPMAAHAPHPNPPSQPITPIHPITPSHCVDAASRHICSLLPAPPSHSTMGPPITALAPAAARHNISPSGTLGG